jgi:uncharacterized membrane protein YphA (DoxX/SURF4 family)
MAESRTRIAFTGLQWTLGMVILIEAVLFLSPAAAHDFSRMHLPNAVRLLLGWTEIIGCVLMLVPRTAIRGAWVLFIVFLFAIVIHVLHGTYNVGQLAIYAAAAWAIAVGK